MILQVWREYQGQLEPVGVFDSSEEGAVVFSYLPEYLEQTSATALSLSLPLRSQAYLPQDYQGFFEGLVPEGRVRTELAHRFRVSPSDYLGILCHLDAESIGALVFTSPQGTSNTSIDPAYQLIDEETLTNLVAFPVRASADLAERGRFSLAGAQAKVGIYLGHTDLPFSEDTSKSLLANCYLPRGAAPSTHILKIPDPGFGDLPANEQFCILVAQQCGLEVARPSVCTIDDTPVFVTKRYDRIISEGAEELDGMPRPQRLHQEDFCQALGLPSYRKYEIEAADNYVAVIARLLERASSNVIEDKKSFARQIIFDYLIGNCDNHIKNFSLLYSPDWGERRLSPAYDIVCTTILGYSRDMGVSVGDTRLIDDISLADWALFAEDLRIPKKLLAELTGALVERYEDACSKAMGQVVRYDTTGVAKRIIADAAERLKKLSVCSEK